MYSGNRKRLNSEQSLISEHFWWNWAIFYNINYRLNSEHLSLVNKIGDKTEFTITRVHCIWGQFWKNTSERLTHTIFSMAVIKRRFYPQNGICTKEYNIWSKMPVKSGLEKFILISLDAWNYFHLILFLPKITNSVTKIIIVLHGRIPKCF